MTPWARLQFADTLQRPPSPVPPTPGPALRPRPYPAVGLKYKFAQIQIGDSVIAYWDAVHSRGFGAVPSLGRRGGGAGPGFRKTGGWARRRTPGPWGEGAKPGWPRQTFSASPKSPPGALPNLAFYGEEVGPSGLGCRRGGVGAAGTCGELPPGAAPAGHELEVASLSPGWATLALRAWEHQIIAIPPHPQLCSRLGMGVWREGRAWTSRLSQPLALGASLARLEGWSGSGSDQAHLGTAPPAVTYLGCPDGSSTLWFSQS